MCRSYSAFRQQEVKTSTSAMAFLGLSFYGKSKTSSENNENIAKTPCSSETSEITEKSTIVDSSVDIMNTDLLNISRISVPDTLIDDIDIVMNENPNLSVIIDPDVFNTSIISAKDSKGDSKSEKVKMIKKW